MRQSIAVLEDNPDRIAAMRDALADKFPFFDLQFFATAHVAIEWLRDHLSHTICIVLDHDLEPATSEPLRDPGTGRDVADFLTSQPPRCPVIVHSSNAPAAIGMATVLEEAGWSVSRVLPFGDLEWISAAWLPLIRGAIVGAVGDLRGGFSPTKIRAAP